jgi:hypothetical protein
MPFRFGEVIKMTDSEVITNQQSFVSTILIFWPRIVLEAEGDSHQVLDSANWCVIVCLVKVIETDHSVGTSGN